MERSAGMGALLRRMEGLLEPLEASGDPGRFFLATYLRTTRAVAGAAPPGVPVMGGRRSTGPAVTALRPCPLDR